MMYHFILRMHVCIYIYKYTMYHGIFDLYIYIYIRDDIHLIPDIQACADPACSSEVCRQKCPRVPQVPFKLGHGKEGMFTLESPWIAAPTKAMIHPSWLEQKPCFFLCWYSVQSIFEWTCLIKFLCKTRCFFSIWFKFPWLLEGTLFSEKPTWW